MILLRDRIRPMLVIAGSGAAIGALGALAGHSDSPPSQAVSLVFSGGWSWACFAFLVGCFRHSKAESAVLASLGLAIGVVVYYVLKALIPVNAIGMDIAVAPSGGDTWSKILGWGTLAFLFGAPLGLFGNLTRIRGVAGLPFRLLVPLIAFFETTMRLDVEAAAAGPAAETTWSAVRVLAVLAAVALVGHTVWGWRARRDGPETGSGSA
ncbi:hypothetical protein ACFXPI_14220 [Streptomyces sp. NPDC059104]|uniref:hypothetical protein n=1 Tax=Streptomyces sp. NPDC059104 TaxID=3346729 RepID=UPI00368B61E6